MAFLSVVVLTYNQEKMLETCLDSILESDTRDVELIISDDCSSDKTTTVIDEWTTRNRSLFDSVTVIKNTTNLGTVKNLINAVAASHAPYIKDIAGDDWFLPKAIDKIMSFCKTNTFDAAFSAVAVAYQDDYGNLCISDRPLPAAKIDNFFTMTHKEKFANMTRTNCLRSPGAIFTRDYWEKVKLSETKLKIVEDWAMWLKGITLEQKFVEIPDILVCYRQLSSSVSNNVLSPRYKTYLSDNAWVLKNIGFSRLEWLSWRNKIRLIFLWMAVQTLTLLPINLIALLEKLRKPRIRKG